MQSNDTYVKDLEETISRFLMPLRDIRFSIVIKAITGFTVIPFDKKDASDRKLLEKLVKAIHNATKAAFNKGIFTNRPNEVGNHIEPFVRKALNDIGVSASIQQPRKESTKLPAILILKSITKRDALILSVKRITSRVVIHHFVLFIYNHRPIPRLLLTQDIC